MKLIGNATPGYFNQPKFLRLDQLSNGTIYEVHNNSSIKHIAIYKLTTVLIIYSNENTAAMLALEDMNASSVYEVTVAPAGTRLNLTFIQE